MNKKTSIKDPVTGKELQIIEGDQSHGNRAVDFKDIHGVEQWMLESLINSLEIHDGERVVDLGCGYGDSSITALRKNPKIKLYPVDVSDFQLSRIKINLPDQIEKYRDSIYSVIGNSTPEINYTKGSITELPFEDNSVDKLIGKMVLHEVSSEEQTLALKEMYRVLREGGKVAIRDIMLKDWNQKLFQNIIRKKDELSGFDTQMNNRYFFREDEFLNKVKEAGFQNIEEKVIIPYRFSSLKRLHQELGGDKRKLKQLNEFIRSEFSNIPDEIKESINFQDDGDDIQFDVIQKKIYVLTK